MSAKGTCLQLSCSFLNSVAHSWGMRSGRVERIWPNLMKVGPRSSSTMRTRSGPVRFSRRTVSTVSESSRTAPSSRYRPES
ncbi:MAG: hypothetical protein ACD_75C01788G0003 [uncultured bacterium]|nr:MAG: hypothetical protein ACD_75C01788G0003 [uncultured bacterium]